jgi:hypothetical protein
VKQIYFLGEKEIVAVPLGYEAVLRGKTKARDLCESEWRRIKKDEAGFLVRDFNCIVRRVV